MRETDELTFVETPPLDGARAELGGYEGCLLAGTFRIGKLLGAGGGSEVYEAKDEASGEKWAVKVLHARLAESPEHLTRFKREARAAARMRHPHVVHVEKLVEDPQEGAFFIVMDLLRGRSLGDVLGELTLPPPLAFVGDVLLPVLRVLALAHERGIIHRDVKPDNVFLESSVGVLFTPKVLDFGLARVFGDPGGSVTSPSHVAGTPEYMSPEQGQSLRHVGPESDLYAIGCMLTELLQLRPPFRGASVIETLAQHLATPPPPLDRPSWAEPLPARLEALRLSLLQKDPAKRPSSASRVSDDLAATLADAGVTLGKNQLPH